MKKTQGDGKKSAVTPQLFRRAQCSRSEAFTKSAPNTLFKKAPKTKGAAPTAKAFATGIASTTVSHVEPITRHAKFATNIAENVRRMPPLPASHPAIAAITGKE